MEKKKKNFKLSKIIQSKDLLIDLLLELLYVVCVLRPEKFYN